MADTELPGDAGGREIPLDAKVLHGRYGFGCPACGCRVGDEGHYRVGGTWDFCPRCGRKAVNHAD